MSKTMKSNIKGKKIKNTKDAIEGESNRKMKNKKDEIDNPAKNKAHTKKILPEKVTKYFEFSILSRKSFSVLEDVIFL